MARAMRAHPEMVAGTRRDVTALMRAVPGLLAKDGFEGVQVAALPDGTAVGVKIADGGDRARMPAPSRPCWPGRRPPALAAFATSPSSAAAHRSATLGCALPLPASARLTVDTAPRGHPAA